MCVSINFNIEPLIYLHININEVVFYGAETSLSHV